MKKLIIIFFLFCCGTIFAQNTQSYYVSANGNDNNDGLSENTSFKTLFRACNSVMNSKINRITIIGTLNKTSESILSNMSDTVFVLGPPEREIIITGKPDANNTERAVLSGSGTEPSVVYVAGTAKIRFEYIEITNKNGEGCLYVSGNSTVTLGPGAIVSSNNGGGIYINSANCIMDGGEIRDSAYAGVVIDEEGFFAMRSGTIYNNNVSGEGGGVMVYSGGKFIMSGGNIGSNGASPRGIGVYVFSGGIFNQEGGVIDSNSRNIVKE